MLFINVDWLGATKQKSSSFVDIRLSSQGPAGLINCNSYILSPVGTGYIFSLLHGILDVYVDKITPLIHLLAYFWLNPNIQISYKGFILSLIAFQDYKTKFWMQKQKFTK